MNLPCPFKVQRSMEMKLKGIVLLFKGDYFQIKKLFLILILSFLLAIPCPIPAQEHDIKPGIIITRDNLDKYLPDLKKFLLPNSFPILTGALEKGWIKNMPIVEKCELRPHPLFEKWTAKNEGKCRIEKGNKLVGWKAGLPFPYPRKGVEVATNIERCHEVLTNFILVLDTYYSINILNRKGHLKCIFMEDHGWEEHIFHPFRRNREMTVLFVSRNR